MADSLLASNRVLDLTGMSGMLCGKIFADLGADVVKVEPPGGDSARLLPPFLGDEPDPERGLLWLALNTSKRGITLDITSEEGAALFLRLAASADFVLESFPPGHLDRVGLSYSRLSEVNPGLILTSITPFGQDGPRSHDQATEFTLLAASGMTYTCGDPDRPPVTMSIEPQASCHGSGAALLASLAALWQRHSTGEGQQVDVSIYESVLPTPMFSLPQWEAAKSIYRRTGHRQRRMHVSYRFIFRCQDGYVAARMGFGPTYGAWGRRLAEAMIEEGLGEDLASVPWEGLDFDSNPQELIDHWEELMAEFFSRHTKREILEIALRRQIALAPLNTMPELLEHEQLKARQYWVELDHPELGRKLVYPGPILRAKGLATGPRHAAPRIGQHNQEIYEGELHIDADELARLRERRVI